MDAGILGGTPWRIPGGLELARLKSISGVSIMHFLNDLHPTLLPTFLPEITARLSLSLAEAGFMSTLFGILNLIVQPFAGRMADRNDKPVFALYAPLFTAAGAYLLAIAPSYGAALLFVAMMGAGTASFHPQGHGLAGFVGGTEKMGLYIAVFSAAGSLGAALSPLYAVTLLHTIGPRFMPFMLIPLLILVALVPRRLMPPRLAKDEAARDGSHGAAKGESFFSGMSRVLLICMPLVLISIVRDSSYQGIRVFLPLLVTGRGGSIAMGGTALFAFTFAGAASNLAGGWLSDRFGKIRIITIMLILAPAFLFPAILMNGIISIALFVLGGACIAATNPITLAMAQEYVPESRSTASSLVMGVSWGIANMAASPIGMVADRIGLTKTLCITALAPLVAAAGIIVSGLVKRARVK
jgi:FSR family fosmidomycin resistance protein-like MFS transporter